MDLVFEHDQAETFIRQLASSSRLPPLHKIKLNSIRLGKDLLISFLSRFSRSLIKLSLQYILLMVGPTWTNFLRELGTVLLLLGSISLKRLAWMPDGADGAISIGILSPSLKIRLFHFRHSILL